MAEALWKVVERRVASMFGSARRPLSGSNSGTGGDDALHKRLHIETKHRKQHSLWTLFRQTKRAAKQERKTPIVAIHEKGCHGILLVIHSDDIPIILREWMQANPDQAEQIVKSTGYKDASFLSRFKKRKR